MKEVVRLKPEPKPEEWRDVPGREGYEVSSWGNMRSWNASRGRRKEPRPMKPWIQKRGGYPAVKLGGGGQNVTVHSMVMLAFVGPRPDGMDIRHLDGNPRNNHLANLCYGTRSENIYDSVRHGTHNRMRKE
jgi:hypothetical protein